MTLVNSDELKQKVYLQREDLFRICKFDVIFLILIFNLEITNCVLFEDVVIYNCGELEIDNATGNFRALKIRYDNAGILSHERESRELGSLLLN